MKEKIKQYLDWKGTYASRASVNYKIWLDRFIEVCGDKPIEEYGIGDYVKYKHWLEARYSSSTCQLATIALKNLLKFYRDQNVACLPPSFIKAPRVNSKSHRALTESEFRKIIAEVPRGEFRHLRDQVVIRMLWDTGVRVSELSDLDLTQISEDKRSTIILTKKTGKKRNIAWSEETHAWLMQYMKERKELENLNTGKALFVGWCQGNGWSQRMCSRTIQRLIKYYVARAGIKEQITPHSFRHGWAHKRRDMNAPLAFIQRGLGHINPISTFIYEQYNDKEFLSNANAYFQPA